MSRTPYPRDWRGWRIPREGSLSRSIYDCMQLGMNAKETGKWIGHDRKSVAVLMCAIKKPASDETGFYVFECEKSQLRRAA